MKVYGLPAGKVLVSTYIAIGVWALLLNELNVWAATVNHFAPSRCSSRSCSSLPRCTCWAGTAGARLKMNSSEHAPLMLVMLRGRAAASAVGRLMPGPWLVRGRRLGVNSFRYHVAKVALSFNLTLYGTCGRHEQSPINNK